MRRVGEVVPLEECKRRALENLSKLHRLDMTRPSAVAYSIWPDAINMRAQGAGLAAVRVLEALRVDGLARLGFKMTAERVRGKFRERMDSGWQITSAGRKFLETTD